MAKEEKVVKKVTSEVKKDAGEKVTKKTTKGKNGETITVTETVKKKTYTPEEYQKTQSEKKETDLGKVIKVLVILFVIILAIAGILVGILKYKESTKLNGRSVSQPVIGTIYKTVDGTGVLKSSTMEKVKSSVSAVVTKVNYTQGQEVRAGALLLELDPVYAKNKITNTENALKDMNNILAMYKTKEEQLKIAADQPGFVKDVKYVQGASVNAGDIIAYFVPTTSFRCVYKVTYDDLKKVEQWLPVTVLYTDDAGEAKTATGVVYDITGESTNGSVVQVGVYITDSKVNLSGKTTTAEIITANGVIKCNEPANIFVAGSIPIYTKQSGSIKNIYTNTGAVTKGTIIAEIANDEVTAKIKEFSNAIAQLQSNMSYLNSNLDSFKVYAQAGGIIQSEALKVGDSVTANTDIITIQTANNITVETEVLSTDIDNIIIGQKAMLYTEVDGKTVELSGSVTYKDSNLILSDVVKPHKVIITLDPEFVKPEIINKNVKVGIILDAKNEAMYVPTDFVYGSGNNRYVLVLNGNDFTQKKVNIGISNSQYTEILEGLSKDQKIISK